MEYEFIVSDLECLNYWEELWGMKFNVDKCKVMHVGTLNPHNEYIFGGNKLQVVEKETDLGVGFSNSFNFEDHIATAIAKANRITGWLSHTIISREPDVMLKLYTSLVRPHLEYCTQVWAPVARYGNWQLISDIEDVQRAFTRMIEGIGLLTYKERLNRLNLTTLLERRMRGDLIETFKIVNNFVDYGSNFFGTSRTQRNLVKRPSSLKPTVNRSDFFGQCILKY